MTPKPTIKNETADRLKLTPEQLSGSGWPQEAILNNNDLTAREVVTFLNVNVALMEDPKGRGYYTEDEVIIMRQKRTNSPEA